MAIAERWETGGRVVTGERGSTGLVVGTGFVAAAGAVGTPVGIHLSNGKQMQ